MMTFDYDVFLSYSSADKALVRPLAERLKQDGLNITCFQFCEINNYLNKI